MYVNTLLQCYSNIFASRKTVLLQCQETITPNARYFMMKRHEKASAKISPRKVISHTPHGRKRSILTQIITIRAVWVIERLRSRYFRLPDDLNPINLCAQFIAYEPRRWKWARSKISSLQYLHKTIHNENSNDLLKVNYCDRALICLVPCFFLIYMTLNTVNL